MIEEQAMPDSTARFVQDEGSKDLGGGRVVHNVKTAEGVRVGIWDSDSAKAAIAHIAAYKESVTNQTQPPPALPGDIRYKTTTDADGKAWTNGTWSLPGKCGGGRGGGPSEACIYASEAMSAVIAAVSQDFTLRTHKGTPDAKLGAFLFENLEPLTRVAGKVAAAMRQIASEPK